MFFPPDGIAKELSIEKEEEKSGLLLLSQLFMENKIQGYLYPFNQEEDE